MATAGDDRRRGTNYCETSGMSLRTSIFKAVITLVQLSLSVLVICNLLFSGFWFAAQPREKAMARYGISIPENVPAVVVFDDEDAHSGPPRTMNWELGSISQNPWGFTLSLLTFCLSIVLIYLLGRAVNPPAGRSAPLLNVVDRL